ncbi:MAG: T9SS type A sorting domain-containing protein [Draconibacterium sp.]|nr:T9SS type A sorting domain-containing protein [Draconibacterium sp.]
MRNKRILFLAALALACSSPRSAIGQEKNNYRAPKVDVSPVIDGIGDEKSWTNAEWSYINQPYDGQDLPDSTDFNGRYKVTWSESRLYVLMEITDDKLVDDRVNPTTNYWDDDCTEFFIDEDNIAEGHECGDNSYNAFAYHIAAVPRDKNNYENGDVMGFDSPDGINHIIDLGTDCNTNNAMNFDDHVNVKITQNGNKYTWELEFKIFDKNYDENSIENTPASLTVDKVIGFAIAYCDDDEGQRDNMIGNVPDHYDYGGPYPFYRFSNEFETVTLVNSTTSSSSISNPKNSSLQNFVWPNPANNTLNIILNTNEDSSGYVKIFNLEGQLLLEKKIGHKKQNIDISNLLPGTYIVDLYCAGINYKHKFIKN